jgi:aspartate carbamoyltransferase regulatory subunit
MEGSVMEHPLEAKYGLSAYELLDALDRRFRAKVTLFCLSRTLSFKDVLEFSTTGKEKLDVEKKAFVA